MYVRNLNRQTVFVLILVAAAVPWRMSAANAGFSDNCQTAGIINETNLAGVPMNVSTTITDKNNGGNPIPGQTYPPGGPVVVAPHATVSINVPPIPGYDRCDAINTWTTVGAGGGGGGGGGIGPGAEAIVRLESLFFDPVLHQYELESIFDFLDNSVGVGVFVDIPDLWADTNNDGMIGAGDVLYSVVDLRAFLNGGNGPIPTYTPGESFNIVNGQVAELPGMLFSTTAFTFDPATGYQGTPYTGIAIALTNHDPAGTPEPSSLLVGAAGIGLLCLLRKRRVRLVR
jgi:MYXO-CTERM domain-containing protein